MKAKIKCETCGQIIGELDKPEITDEDQEQYRAMCDCDQGHQAVFLEIMQDD